MADTPYEQNPQLTAIAIGYRNPGMNYIADRVMPRLRPELDQKEYEYNEYDLANSFTVPDTEVGRKGEPGEVTYKHVLKPGVCKDYGLKETVPYDDVKQGEKKGMRVLGQATERVADLVMLAREKRVAAQVFDASNYKSSLQATLSGTAKFSHRDSDPIGVIKDAMHATLVFRANVMTIGEAAWLKLARHPAILQAVHANEGSKGIATLEQVRMLFGLEEILVGMASINTAEKGQEVNIGDIWGPHIQLQYRNRLASNRNGVTWGGTMQYGKRFAMTKFDDDIGLRGAHVVKVGETLDEKILAKDVGYLIRNVI